MSYLTTQKVPLDIFSLVVKFLPSEALIVCADIEGSAFDRPEFFKQCAEEELDVQVEDTAIKETLKESHRTINILKNLVPEKKLASYCIDKGYFHYFKKYWDGELLNYTEMSVIYWERPKFLKFLLLEDKVDSRFFHEHFFTGDCKYTDEQIKEIIDIDAPRVTKEKALYAFEKLLRRGNFSVAVYAYEKYKLSFDGQDTTHLMWNVKGPTLTKLPKNILIQIVKNVKSDKALQNLIEYVIKNSSLEVIKIFESYIIKYDLAEPYHLALERGDKDIVAYMFSDAGGKVKFLTTRWIDKYIKIIY